MSIQSSFNSALAVGAYFARQSPRYEGNVAAQAIKTMHKHGTEVNDPEAAASLREATRRNYYTMIRAGKKGAVEGLNAYNADIAAADEARAKAIEEGAQKAADRIKMEEEINNPREEGTYEEVAATREPAPWDEPRPQVADYSDAVDAVEHRQARYLEASLK